MLKSLQIEDNEIDKFLIYLSMIEGRDQIFVKKMISKLKKLRDKQPIKISSRKAKGRGLQKWVCQRIADIFNIKYDQSDDACAVHSREMGLSGSDIVLRGAILDNFLYSIECKNSEHLNLIAAIDQAKCNQKINTDWLVVYKKKGLVSPIIIMDWFAFEQIIRKLNARNNI